MQTPSLSRREVLRFCAAGTATLALPSCAAQLASAPAPQSATELLDAIAWRLLELSPMGATSLGLDVGAHAALRSRLGDSSPAGIAKLRQTLMADLKAVEAVDSAGLDATTRTSLAVVRSAFRVSLDGLALPYGDVAVGSWRNTPYVVIQNVGAYLDIPRFLDADHPVRDAADAEAYLSRLGEMDALLDGELVRMQAATAQGLVPPDFLLDKAIVQMGSTLSEARQGGGLVTSLTGRAQGFPGDWDKRARAIVADQVVPALERQLAELKRQRGKATSAPGMRERPHGSEFYAWALRASTTTTQSADEIHERGLQELAALHTRMDPILRKLGFTSGTVGQRMNALGADPRFKFAEGDPGRAEIMAFIQQRIAWIRGQMPRAFRTLVPGNLEVRRLPPAEEPGAPGAYGGAGSIDGSIPGKMWINLHTTDLHRKYDLPTLVHHEAIPGHVWQGEYANRLPLIRSILSFNAYSEGWALYGEQLGDELGTYDDDPVGRLGYLQSLAFRACRMVVDTGLHARGWSREEGVRFFVEQNGSNAKEVASEVDRYCSWPGQACGYKMGHSEINRQRERAKAELGDRYDLRDFDQAVVDGGNVPLDVLAQNISGYIAGNRG
jgi:uncharacterized protein (DUF885 family)